MIKKVFEVGFKLPIVREVLVQIPAEILVRNSKTRTWLLRSRQLRKEMEYDQWWQRVLAGGVDTTTDAAVIMADAVVGPSVLGLWGPGDVVGLIEALSGREVNGQRLDTVNRWLSGGAAVAPLAPYRTIIGPIRGFRNALEDITQRKALKRGLIDESTTH